MGESTAASSPRFERAANVVPMLRWLPRYSRRLFRGDVLAGAMVAALLIPQSLGYARIAGVPVEVGLYAVPLALLAYAALGSSPQLVVGPASTVAIVSGSLVADIARDNPEDAVAITAGLAIVAGVMLAVTGVLRVSWLAEFLSKPIVTGFVFGLTLTIIIGEIPTLLGIPKPRGDLLEVLVGTVGRLDQVDGLTALVGGTALVVDLSDELAVWEALDGFQEGLGGPPDVVVNAAGAFGIAPVQEETVRSLDEQWTVNLRGSFLTVRALLPAMLARRSGLVVNVGSVAGRKAFPGNAAYSASKFGLRGFHEVLLEETRGTGVRATLLEPAATDTPLWDPMDPDSNPALPDRAGMLTPDDVAEAVLFVATRPATVRIPVLQIERA